MLILSSPALPPGGRVASLRPAGTRERDFKNSVLVFYLWHLRSVVSKIIVNLIETHHEKHSNLLRCHKNENRSDYGTNLESHRQAFEI